MNSPLKWQNAYLRSLLVSIYICKKPKQKVDQAIQTDEQLQVVNTLLDTQDKATATNDILNTEDAKLKISEENGINNKRSPVIVDMECCAMSQENILGEEKDLDIKDKKTTNTEKNKKNWFKGIWHSVFSKQKHKGYKAIANDEKDCGCDHNDLKHDSKIINSKQEKIEDEHTHSIYIIKSSISEVVPHEENNDHNNDSEISLLGCIDDL